MTTIYKYQLKVEDKQTLQLPHGYRILSLQMQHGQICLWCEVDTIKPLIDVTFYCRGTGHEIDFAGHHIGTVIAGHYVWHFYTL